MLSLNSRPTSSHRQYLEDLRRQISLKDRKIDQLREQNALLEASSEQVHFSIKHCNPSIEQPLSARLQGAHSVRQTPNNPHYSKYILNKYPLPAKDSIKNGLNRFVSPKNSRFKATNSLFNPEITGECLHSSSNSVSPVPKIDHSQPHRGLQDVENAPHRKRKVVPLRPPVHLPAIFPVHEIREVY